MDENGDRIRELGGLVLIDDEPEYLAVAADGTFRSRTRFQDDEGEWVAETEVIESAAELVEIYNPSDLYAAFAEAARIEAGLEPEPTAAEDLLEVAGRGLGDGGRAGTAARAGRGLGGLPERAGRQGRRGPHALRPRAHLPGAQPAPGGRPAG